MKSLWNICSISAKVTSKQCSDAMSLSLFCRIKLFKVIHLLFIGYFICLLKLSLHQMFIPSYTCSVFHLCKVSKMTSKPLSQNAVLTLLCYFAQLKQREFKAW